MASWREFVIAAPELAERVRGLFVAHKHHTMATLHLDGAPRLSGTEVRIEGGELVLAMMAGTRRASDLRRDPRLAIHSHTTDPDEKHATWSGDAKIEGRAVEMSSTGREPVGSDWFRVELDRVVLTCLGSPPDHLVIESWSNGRRSTIERR